MGELWADLAVHILFYIRWESHKSDFYDLTGCIKVWITRLKICLCQKFQGSFKTFILLHSITENWKSSGNSGLWEIARNMHIINIISFISWGKPDVLKGITIFVFFKDHSLPFISQMDDSLLSRLKSMLHFLLWLRSIKVLKFVCVYHRY